MTTDPDAAIDELTSGLADEDRERLRAILRRLSEAGAEPDEIREALEGGRLALVSVERALAGGERFSANEIAERVGVPREVLERQWRALGLALDDPDEPIWSRADLEAAERVRALLETGISPQALEETARVMAMALAQVAASNREMVTDLVLGGDGAGNRLEDAEDGAAEEQDLRAEIDAAERFTAIAEALVPLVGPALEHLYKLQLLQQLRNAVVDVSARREGRSPGVDQTAIAFADLVGFTRLGEELPPEDFGDLTLRFSSLAVEVATGPVRLVKMIGDAAMFACPDPAGLADALLELLELVDQEEDFPGVRAGMSWGAAVSRGGDLYGRPVNLASRLTGVARPGSLLVAADDVSPLEAGFKLSDAGHKRLKGIDGAVHMFRVRDLPEDEEEGGGRGEGEDPDGDVSRARRGSRRRRARRS